MRHQFMERMEQSQFLLIKAPELRKRFTAYVYQNKNRAMLPTRPMKKPNVNDSQLAPNIMDSSSFLMDRQVIDNQQEQALNQSLMQIEEERKERKQKKKGKKPQQQTTNKGPTEYIPQPSEN